MIGGMRDDVSRPPPNKGGAHDDDNSWRHHAVCAKTIQVSPYFLDIWFQDEQHNNSAVATTICFRCPVRKECLKQACETKEADGIWGGLPPSVRTKRGKAHNYLKLVDLPDPYETTDKASPFHILNLGKGDDNGR